MKWALIFLILFTGCAIQDLSAKNDEKIREYKKCKEAGMDVFMNDFGQILCTPPKKKEVKE